MHTNETAGASLADRLCSKVELEMQFKEPALTMEQAEVVRANIALLREKLGGQWSYPGVDLIVERLRRNFNIADLQPALGLMVERMGLGDVVLQVALADEQWMVGGHVEMSGEARQEKFPIRIREDLRRYPFSAVAVLCHELCHVFLRRHGIWLEDERQNELLTDVTAGYLGFGKIMLNGCTDAGILVSPGSEIQKSGQQVGYLTPSQIAYAYILCKQTRHEDVNGEGLKPKGLAILRKGIEETKQLGLADGISLRPDAAPPVIQEGFLSYLKRAFSYSGRATQREFVTITFSLIGICVGLAYAFTALLPLPEWVGLIVMTLECACLASILTTTIRRFHDAGRRFSYYSLIFFPISFIMALFSDSENGLNVFGPAEGGAYPGELVDPNGGEITSKCLLYAFATVVGIFAVCHAVVLVGEQFRDVSPGRIVIPRERRVRTDADGVLAVSWTKLPSVLPSGLFSPTGDVGVIIVDKGACCSYLVKRRQFSVERQGKPIGLNTDAPAETIAQAAKVLVDSGVVKEAVFIAGGECSPELYGTMDEFLLMVAVVKKGGQK